MTINEKFDDFYKKLSEKEKADLIQHITEKYTNLNIVMEGLDVGKLAILDGLNTGPIAKLNTSNVCGGCGRPL